MPSKEPVVGTSHPASPSAPSVDTDPGPLGLREVIVRSRRMGLRERTRFFTTWVRGMRRREDSLHLRPIGSPTDRVTLVGDHTTEGDREMLMFGANSYLGLMTHPHVKRRMKEAIDAYGVGLSGSPLLNGRSRLHMALEERIAAMKGKEEAVIFQSGYGANVGLLSTLTGRADHILCDRLSHASFMDGTKMSAARTLTFGHNDTAELAALLDGLDDSPGETFVGVEGVYSMDGDLAPLDEIAALCRRHDAFLIVDDAHGTGVTGPGGRGSASHFGVTSDVDLILATFSKAFGVTGAAVATSSEIAEYLRYNARSYVFSTSIPPASVAAVMASLDVLEREPGVHQRLLHNMAYTARGLRQLGFELPEPESAIIALMAPEGLDVRSAIRDLHRRGIFLNTIEYPAVPVNQQRFRISLMATHTEADIDRLLEVFAEVWDAYAPPEHRLSRSGAGNQPIHGDGYAGSEPDL
jgi:glycine C-acetyltransferase